MEPFFDKAKVFVAPLRYGAGMKGKIGQSISFGLPVVTTNIGAEGMDLVHGKNVMIADTAGEFSKVILEIYQDPGIWKLISSEAITSIERFSPQSMKEKLGIKLDGLLQKR